MTTVLLAFITLSAYAQADPAPQQLKEWRDWVLRDSSVDCVAPVAQEGRRECYFTGDLAITIKGLRGTFELPVTVYKEVAVSLPGGRAWPSDVTAGGKLVPVIQVRNKPVVYLEPGSYVLRGTLELPSASSDLQLPELYGLLRVTVDGRKIDRIEIDRQGRLRFRQLAQRETSEADTITATVFRKLSDSIPFEVETRIKLHVGGDAREVVLGPIVFQDHHPLFLNSNRPARLEPDGTLRLQVARGAWAVNIRTRALKPVNELTLKAGNKMPLEELWVIEQHSDLRKIEWSGLPQIDPQQTELPEAWRKFPAFVAKVGQTLTIKELQRGDPTPVSNRLSLSRVLWRDFENGGYSVKDTIEGEMRRDWRLSLASPFELGRALIADEPQFITRLANGTRGVEVRQSSLNFIGESRIPTGEGKLPVSGWDTDFESVSAQLYLPPGWRAIHISGPDFVSATWFSKWNLLNVFLAGLIALAFGRIFGWLWGGVAVVTLLATFHAPLAPVWAWVLPLLAIGLLRYFKEGRAKRILEFFQRISLMGLGLMVIFFAVDQVRAGLYPQLRETASVKPYASLTKAPKVISEHAVDERRKDKEGRRAELEQSKMFNQEFYDSSSDEPRKQRLQYDPDAKIQTGAGLPTWAGQYVQLKWSGPVRQDETFSLIVAGPIVNLFWAIANVILVSLLFVRLLGTYGLKSRFGGWKTTVTVMVVGVLLNAGVTPSVEAAPFPSNDLLGEYQKYLEKPAACSPQCAAINRVAVRLTEHQLRLDLVYHAEDPVAVPIPITFTEWQPTAVIVNGLPAKQLWRQQSDLLWLPIKKGETHVQVIADVSTQKSITLPLSSYVHNISVEAKGWQVSGYENGQVLGGNLQFARQQLTTKQELDPTEIPAFAIVNRRLSLGLTWDMQTSVVRYSHNQESMLIEYPLLPGEEVLSQNVQVKDGIAWIRFPAGITSVHFASRVAINPVLVLKASVGDYAESWSVFPGPIWHMEQMNGIAPILVENRTWGPTWRPWAGESVALDIKRPEGVSGATHTARQVNYRVKAGNKQQTHTLTLSITSSQGARHMIALPENSAPLKVLVDGRAIPLDESISNMAFPLTPGEQEIILEWRQAKEDGTWLSTPAIDIGMPVANINVSATVPNDRWVLYLMGPRLGPVILFWGVFLLLLIFSAALGWLKIRPLKTWQWAMLVIGLAPVSIVGLAVVATWFFLLALRERVEFDKVRPLYFNTGQIALVLATLAATSVLFTAVQTGLLGYPDMMVEGNGSSRWGLQWYEDRTEGILPVASVFSLPIWVYRAVMLLWALWLANSVLRWAKWSWESFTAGGAWKRLPKKEKVDVPDKKAVPKALPDKPSEGK
ncbi:hypothetical protein MD588_19280 [Photobacterium sp. SDRW27]|uniref:hypothetical protein n=1 Tax=Photobacterium obscurum TaxID=2829490 RepID=UPI0022432EA1|nr:hypothetical protein [Photobacterium obscurum]MCW8330940.1 hypothetical protein [Photobacterium obscurum]